MLIATLPTLVSKSDLLLSERILSHPLIGGVRYNTGGDSPCEPQVILDGLKLLTEKFEKPLWVDLEGRQVRVAEWTPFERGCVVLNRDFEIRLPGKIYFRGAGWCEITNARSKARKVYFEPLSNRFRYFFGATQSVHIVAEKFEVKGYMGGQDSEFVRAATQCGINRFMLSFVERLSDVQEVTECIQKHAAPKTKSPELVLKIESVAGIKFLRTVRFFEALRLMAARDDLFLNFVDNRSEFLNALIEIIGKNPTAILASKIMSGLESGGQEAAMGDLADVALMALYGYEHFMLSDELSRNFDSAMRQWETVLLPMVEKIQQRRSL